MLMSVESIDLTRICLIPGWIRIVLSFAVVLVTDGGTRSDFLTYGSMATFLGKLFIPETGRQLASLRSMMCLR
jgi:hypothetical protein